MKRINALVAILGLSAAVLVSCNNASPKAEGAEDAMSEDHPHPHGDHERPPHRDGEKGHEGRGGHEGHGKKGPRKGGLPEQTKTLEEIGGYGFGDVATDFSLKNVDGKMVSLADFKNAKGYVVVFTCNGCPFSKMYEERLIELNNTYAPKGYPVIAINPNSDASDEEGFDAMKARATEKGFTFPYLEDAGQEIFPQYGAVRTPHVFLLDQDRKVQYIGAIDDNSKSAADVKVKYVENAIAALERGEQPSPNFTKAIGCPVKAKM